MPNPWMEKDMGPLGPGGIGRAEAHPSTPGEWQPIRTKAAMPVLTGPPGLGGALADLEVHTENLIGELGGLGDLLAPIMVAGRPIETIPGLEMVDTGSGSPAAKRVNMVVNRIRSCREILQAFRAGIDL